MLTCEVGLEWAPPWGAVSGSHETVQEKCTARRRRRTVTACRPGGWGLSPRPVLFSLSGCGLHGLCQGPIWEAGPRPQIPGEQRGRGAGSMVPTSARPQLGSPGLPHGRAGRQQVPWGTRKDVQGPVLTGGSTWHYHETARETHRPPARSPAFRCPGYTLASIESVWMVNPPPRGPFLLHPLQTH